MTTSDSIIRSVRRDVAARGVPCDAVWVGERELNGEPEVVVRCDDSVTVHAATIDRHAAARRVEACWSER